MFVLYHSGRLGVITSNFKIKKGGRGLPCFDFKLYKKNFCFNKIYLFFISIKIYFKYSYLIFKKFLQYLYFFVNLRYNYLFII